MSLGVSSGSRWQEMGRAWLENRAARLIGVQGSFSQYSVNYHRVVLDTFSMVEIWRRHLALPDFSARLQSRLVAASQWLCAVVDPMTGAAPNLGANDGARLLPLTSGNDRDFRPCVQLAMVLFTQGRAYAADGDWNLPLHWLGIAVPDDVSARPMSDVFDDGGFAVLRHHRAMVLLNYPRFRFRPSQADLLHVDLWKDGINLLRDAGTYSYHTDSDSINYFSGTASHNTLQFDSQDQMPRLGRFLFGHWLKTHEIEPLQENADNLSFAAAYRDHRGIYHKRSIKLLPNKLQVLDEMDGFRSRAVMRWRLAPGQWWIDGNTVTNGFDRLTIESNVPILCMALVVGQESLFYLHKNDVPVLEVEVNQPGTMMSEYEWML